LTFGFVLGERVRRVTGRTLASIVYEEIAAPLGVTDELHFGVPRRLLARVARDGPEGAQPATSPWSRQSMTSSPHATAEPPSTRAQALGPSMVAAPGDGLTAAGPDRSRRSAFGRAARVPGGARRQI